MAIKFAGRHFGVYDNFRRMNHHRGSDYSLTILETHLDTFGHVNNATYLQILEQARWEIVTARGFGLEQIHKSHQGPTILEIQLKFLKELRLRQKISIRTQLISQKGKIYELQQQIFNEEEEVCCEAIFKMGFFDLKLRKLIAPSPEWLHALGASAT